MKRLLRFGFLTTLSLFLLTAISLTGPYGMEQAAYSSAGFLIQDDQIVATVFPRAGICGNAPTEANVFAQRLPDCECDSDSSCISVDSCTPLFGEVCNKCVWPDGGKFCSNSCTVL